MYVYEARADDPYGEENANWILTDERRAEEVALARKIARDNGWLAPDVTLWERATGDAEPEREG